MEKKLLAEIVLSYQKRISLMDDFIILQLSANEFRVRAKGGKHETFGSSTTWYVSATCEEVRYI